MATLFETLPPADAQTLSNAADAFPAHTADFSTYFKPKSANDAWYELPYTSSGDYAGHGALGRANSECFLEHAEECAICAETLVTVVGHYGYSAVYARGDNACAELARMMADLEAYPCLDEDAWAELQCEEEGEAWENWARYDLERALEARFEVESDFPKLNDIVWDIMDRANLYWEHGTEGPYLDIARLAAAFTAEDIREAME